MLNTDLFEVAFLDVEGRSEVELVMTFAKVSREVRCLHLFAASARKIKHRHFERFKHCHRSADDTEKSSSEQSVSGFLSGIISDLGAVRLRTSLTQASNAVGSSTVCDIVTPTCKNINM